MDNSHTGLLYGHGLWFKRVLELCQVHALSQDNPDNSGIPGSSIASHVEKKLSGYHIDEHLILPRSLLERTVDLGPSMAPTSMSMGSKFLGLVIK